MLLLHVMFLMRYCNPGLLLTWQLWWLLAGAAPLLERSANPAGVPLRPWKLTTIWSWHFSDFPQESSRGQTLSADEEASDDFGSSAHPQVITSPQLTEGELLPEPDRFPAPGQNLREKPTQPGRLRETVLNLPSLRDIKNQAPALPLRIERLPLRGPKSKIQTMGQDKVVGLRASEMHVPPLDRPSSKGTKVFSHLYFKKAVAGTQSMKTVDSDSPPLYSQNSGEPPESLGRDRPSQSQLETQTRTPPTPELVQSLSPQQEAPSQLPQLLDEAETPIQSQHAPGPGELVPSGLQEGNGPSASRSEAQNSATAIPADVEVTIASEAGKQAQPTTLSQQLAPAQYPESPEEAELPSTQQEAQDLTSELSEDLDSSESQLEAPGLPEKPSQEVKAPFEEEPSVPAPDSSLENIAEMPPTTVQTPTRDQENFPVTMKPNDVEITVTSEPTKEAEYSPAQQGPPAQPPGSPVEDEPFLSQEQEAALPSESAGEAESSVNPLNSPDELPEESEEVDSDSESQMEAAAQPENPLEEVKPPVEPEGPVQTSDSSSVEGEIESTLPNTTVRPSDIPVTLTPETTTEAESSPAQEETPAQPPEASEEVEPPPPPAQEEAETQPPEGGEEEPPSLGEREDHSSQPVGEELSPDQVLSDSGANTGATTPPSTTDTLTFSLQDLEMMFRGHHSQLAKTTVKHVDVALTVTPEPTTEVGVPIQPSDLDQSIVPTEQTGFSPVQTDFSSQLPDFPEAESSPDQQEPVPPANEAPNEGDSSTRLEIPVTQQTIPSQPIELPGDGEPSPELQPTPAQPSEASIEGEPATPPQQVVPPELPEPSPAQYGTTTPTPGQSHTHHLTSLGVTTKALDLELTISSEPTREAENSTTLTNTASPPPVHPEAKFRIQDCLKPQFLEFLI